MSLETFFIERVQKLNSKIQKIQSRLDRISIFRLLFFFTSVASLVYFYTEKKTSYYYLISLIIFIIFLILFVLYSKLLSYRQRLVSYKNVLHNEEKRNHLDLESFYDYEIGYKKYSPNCSYANDLGLLGKNGLITYLNCTSTKQGEENFYKLISGEIEFNSKDILDRQNILKEIDSNRYFTLKLLRIFAEAGIEETSSSKIDLNLLLKSNDSFKIPSGIKYIFKPYIILIWISTLLLFLLGLPNFSSTLFFLNTILFILFKKKVSILLKKLEKIEPSIPSLRRLSAYLPVLKTMKIENRNESKKMFTNLEKILYKLSIHNSPLIHYLLNMLFLWDLWQLSSYEKWVLKYEDAIRTIKDSLLKIDSISPFANLQFLNPQFSFPSVDEKLKSIKAESISHPLIKENLRVANPLNKQSIGEALIITGSNMSGKTTYLRTIGINILLAKCGSVVACKNLELPPIQILTSIKNEDSLENGISFFYSEVKRIGEILKATKENRTSLILLDELLKGTNSRERLIASEEILKQLSKTKSIIFITTHDVSLAKKTKKQKLAYFQEKLDQNKLDFDFKIKEGIIKSTNALKILELENIGLKFK